MTFGMLLGLLSLATVESLNPSALVMTIALLSRPNPASRVIAYTAGIFVVFFSLGIAAVLGGAPVLHFIKELRHRPVAYAAQLPVGLALLASASYFLRRPLSAKPSRLAQPPSGSVGAVFLIAIGVTLFEALTAFPYFGALAILLDAEFAKRRAIEALAGFNLIFITPPLLLLWVTHHLGRRSPAFLARVRGVLEYEGRQFFLWILVVAGVYLSADAIYNFFM